MTDAYIVVLATEHPDRDEWVDEHARQEAESSGVPLGPYQGTTTLPTGARVHLFCSNWAAATYREAWIPRGGVDRAPDPPPPPSGGNPCAIADGCMSNPRCPHYSTCRPGVESTPAWAHHLLTALLTGEPLNFKGERLPDDIRDRLEQAMDNGALGSVRWS